MHNQKYIAGKDLPPVKLTYLRHKENDGKDVILQPGLTTQPSLINYEFPSKDYVWKPGLYFLTFKIDLYPNDGRPKLVQTSFNVKNIESDEDRLNVLWFKYDHPLRQAWIRDVTAQEFEDSRKALDSLIESLPNNAALIHERYFKNKSRLELQQAIADLTRVIELVEKEQSSTRVETGNGHGHENNGESETLKRLRYDLKDTKRLAVRVDTIKAVNEKSSLEDRQNVIKELLYPYTNLIPPVALDKIQELKMAEAIPALLEVMKKPNGDLVYFTVRSKAYEVLKVLRPEVGQIPYAYLASPEEKAAVVEQIKTLLNMKD